MKFKNFLIKKELVITFGRMNPFTYGHFHLAKKLMDEAGFYKPRIYLSHTTNPQKDPLSYNDKIKFANEALIYHKDDVEVKKSKARTIIEVLKEIEAEGIKDIVLVVGSDRVTEFKTLLNRYNGKDYNFNSIKVISAGKRDPDAEGVEGMSASKIREYAAKGDFEKFKKGVPFLPKVAKELYDKVRKGMGIKEDLDIDFEELLTEGVHDKSIFKAVFLAGGPGSGKDYVLDNTLQGHGLVEINSDKALEFLMDKKGLDKTMPASEKNVRDLVRGRAKNMTEVKQRLALQGRNGLIINGTGDDLAKVTRIKKALEGLGYDTSMIMVNTSDEISAQRNIERGQRGGRTVPETVRKEKWDSAQDARTEYARMFGDRYMEFDNSEDLRTASPDIVKQKKMEMMQLFKNVQEFVLQPPQSEKAEEWVANELEKKDILPISKNGPEKTPPHGSGAAEEAKKLGLQYYGFGRYGMNGKVTYRSVHDQLVAVSDVKKEDIDILDEFRTISSYSKKELDKPLIKFKKIKDKYRKLINTPLSNEFDVYYFEVGGFHEYVFTEKNTGEPIGSFEIEMPWGNTSRPKVVKPGVKIVTPHLSFIPKYQGKGLAKRTYLAFLKMKNYVFETDRHTKEAGALWDSLARDRDIVTFYYDKENGKVSKTSMNNDDEVKYLGLKSDFNLPKGIKEDIDLEFEELFSEDLRKWFDKDHPEGGWKRINSKGEAVGPCAREPGEAKPKCMSNEKRASLSKKERASAVAVKRKHDPDPERKGKPINVSNFGKGKLSESIDDNDFREIEEEKEVKLLKDKSGRVRVFMLRAAAAREAHNMDGTVLKYKNGYVIKLKEEIEDVEIFKGSIRNWIAENRRETPTGGSSESIGREDPALLSEATTPDYSNSCEKASAETTRPKISLAEIRQRKAQKEANDTRTTSCESTEINEIDRGIEPGISMAGAGESIGRDMGEKIKKRSHKVSVTELTGDETTASISAQKEDELKKVGISLNKFKSKRPIG
jgi:nicotinic acid mononucleotide adenylyltransferase